MKITPDRRSSGQKEGEKKGNGQRESDPLRHEDSAEIVSQYFEEEIQAADEMVKHTEYQLESLKVQDLKKQKDDPPTVVLYFDDPNQSIEASVKDVFPPSLPRPKLNSPLSATACYLPRELLSAARELDFL